jgi:hypothetical protein
MAQKMFDEGEPVAEITRVGRRTYQIQIVHGLTSCGSWRAYSRPHAERKAREKLAWYKRKFGPPREQWTISD